MIIFIFKFLLVFILIVIFSCLLFIFRNYKARLKINYEVIDKYISKSKFIQKFTKYLLILNIKKGRYIVYFFIIFSFFISIVFYFISYKFFSVLSVSFIISIFSFFLPYNFIRKIYYNQKNKILKILPTYIISLETYTHIKNDIIVAFKNTKTVEPLRKYIDRFNMYVKKGINVIEAFELLKKDIDINEMNSFISSLQICYANGGNFNILLKRYSELISKINLQKEKEEQENFSSILILVILIIINIFLLFSFVFSNEEYKNIITETFVGKIILNINVISYIFIYFVITKIKRKDV